MCTYKRCCYIKQHILQTLEMMHHHFSFIKCHDIREEGPTKPSVLVAPGQTVIFVPGPDAGPVNGSPDIPPTMKPPLPETSLRASLALEHIELFQEPQPCTLVLHNLILCRTTNHKISYQNVCKT